MTRKERKATTIYWLKDNKILYVDSNSENQQKIHGKCDIYVRRKGGKYGKQWQFDLYDKYMDINLVTWGEGDYKHDVLEDFKDLIEFSQIPFASDPKQLDSLMELTNFKIK